MNLPIIVLGAGGHAKVLLDTLLRCGASVLGLADANPALYGRHVLGSEVLGGDNAVLRHAPETILLANGVGSVDSMKSRATLYDRFKQQGYRFATIIHPAAIIAREVLLGEGAQVLAGVIIQPGTTIGENSIVNTRASVDHDCRIGAHVHLAPGVVLSGGVTVGDSTHVGTGATIIHSVTIGAGCLIAAGAVVVANVLPNARVAGVPAREQGGK